MVMVCVGRNIWSLSWQVIATQMFNAHFAMLILYWHLRSATAPVVVLENQWHWAALHLMRHVDGICISAETPYHKIWSAANFFLMAILQSVISQWFAKATWCNMTNESMSKAKQPTRSSQQHPWRIMYTAYKSLLSPPSCSANTFITCDCIWMSVQNSFWVSPWALV